MTSSDTTREARQAQIAAWKRLGPGGRVAMAWEMSESARALSIAGLRARCPELSPEHARMRLLRRVLGDALFDAAYTGTTPKP